MKQSALSVERLRELEAEIKSFAASEDLNGFQRWIVEGLYGFEAEGASFEPRSVIVLAVPHPPYAHVEFAYRGSRHAGLSLVPADLDAAGRELAAGLAAEGYAAQRASRLPLKRLAVRSGLAAYGRDNITYVEGLGSFFSLDAYFTDKPCVDDPWTELRVAPACRLCRSCIEACPLGAIREDRFLIDNERCLSCHNERPEPFPEWIPPKVHHSPYDCLRCQLACPMNRPYLGRAIGPICFDEAETETLLAGKAFEELQPELKAKSRLLGLYQWAAALPRNLRALLEAQA
jgi:Uncharacterized Fe-S protein